MSFNGNRGFFSANLAPDGSRVFDRTEYISDSMKLYIKSRGMIPLFKAVLIEKLVRGFTRNTFSLIGSWGLTLDLGSLDIFGFIQLQSFTQQR